MIPLRDLNPTKRFAIVTFILIVLNFFVFLYELTLREASEKLFIESFALIPQRLFSPGTMSASTLPAVATLFSSQFLHWGILHVASNMLYLWIFGNNVEDAMGKMRFIIFYLLCGLFAAYAHALMNSSSVVPMIGASGAVSGVLGAYLLLYPRARVMTLIVFGFYVRTVQIPAMYILLFWFLLQFVNALIAGGSGSGVAWYAHIAGFVAGMLMIGLFKRQDVDFLGGRIPRHL